MNKPSKAKKKAVKRKNYRRYIIHFNWAIKHFDDIIENWSDEGNYAWYRYWKGDDDKIDQLTFPRNFYVLRSEYIPPILNRLKYNGSIDDQTRDRLAHMCLSSDRNDWHMAFVVIKSHLKNKTQ